jgi:hypothetical protein
MTVESLRIRNALQATIPDLLSLSATYMYLYSNGVHVLASIRKIL